MHYFLRNCRIIEKIHHLSIRLHVLGRTTLVLLPSFAFMAFYSWEALAGRMCVRCAKYTPKNARIPSGSPANIGELLRSFCAVFLTLRSAVQHSSVLFLSAWCRAAVVDPLVCDSFMLAVAM